MSARCAKAGVSTVHTASASERTIPESRPNRHVITTAPRRSNLSFAAGLKARQIAALVRDDIQPDVTQSPMRVHHPTSGKSSRMHLATTPNGPEAGAQVFVGFGPNRIGACGRACSTEAPTAAEGQTEP